MMHTARLNLGCNVRAALMDALILFGGTLGAGAVVILRWRYIWISKEEARAFHREYLLTELLLGIVLSTTFCLMLLVGGRVSDIYLWLLVAIVCPLTAWIAWLARRSS